MIPLFLAAVPSYLHSNNSILSKEAELIDVVSVPTSGSWEDDFSNVASHLEATEPCYILYRLDSTNNLGHEWVLITYVPDKAKVRHKMLYSSTKASLKMGLGGGRFSQEIHATTPVRTKFVIRFAHYYISSPLNADPFYQLFSVSFLRLQLLL